MNNLSKESPVFTSKNEPCLGRESVYHFDQVILSCLEANTEIAANLVKLTSGGIGYSVGKVLNEPEFCDFICYQSYCYLIVIMGRMAGCFPETKNRK